MATPAWKNIACPMCGALPGFNCFTPGLSVTTACGPRIDKAGSRKELFLLSHRKTEFRPGPQASSNCKSGKHNPRCPGTHGRKHGMSLRCTCTCHKKKVMEDQDGIDDTRTEK